MYPTITDKPRIALIDVARGLALVAMAIYHFGWDLEFFGYLAPGTAETGGMRLFARCIASSFLILVGISLFLAHERGFRWRSYWRRLAMIALAAGAITLVTWLAVPGGFIFFGILHQIAVASMLGLAFIHLPAALTLVAAAAVIALPHYFRSAFFDHPALWWVGLSDMPPHSNDYVPVFPWFGAVLVGVAAASIARRTGLFGRLAQIRAGAWSRPLTFLGRHSLATYLIHQPVLISCVWIYAQFWPAPAVSPQENFTRACNAQCLESRDSSFCSRYCACALDEVRKEGLLYEVFAPQPTEGTRTRMADIAGYCSTASEPSDGSGALDSSKDGGDGNE